MTIGLGPFRSSGQKSDLIQGGKPLDQHIPSLPCRETLRVQHVKETKEREAFIYLVKKTAVNPVTFSCG